MDWLKRFMLGRYGSDQLTIALLISSMILNAIGSLGKLQLLSILAYVPLGIGIYRILSKDLSRRRMENYKFSVLISPVYSWFRKTFSKAKDSKTHNYYSCPGCKATLRVPKGKGNIVITCPKCKTEIRRRT